jgi:RNA polymerase sigma-70 factor (ECF subfamily)
VNDREWIQAALQRYETPLLQYAARIAGTSDGARDAVQETFLELVEAERSAVEPRLAPWLFTVCRNKALDLRRKDGTMNASRAEAAELTGERLDPSAAMVQGEERARMAALLARLPEKQQEVLRLKFQGGLSYREIASVTGNSIGNVGFLLHVALRSLRDRLAVEGKVAS